MKRMEGEPMHSRSVYMYICQRCVCMAEENIRGYNRVCVQTMATAVMLVTRLVGVHSSEKHKGGHEDQEEHRAHQDK
jgi:hypothetical protein